MKEQVAEIITALEGLGGFFQMRELMKKLIHAFVPLEYLDCLLFPYNIAGTELSGSGTGLKDRNGRKYRTLS